MAGKAGRPVIIVFGAGVRPDGTASPTLASRTEAAAAFGEGLTPAPIYLPTGGVGRFGPSEASVMGGILRARGIGDDRILLEETARDTLDSVVACRRLLRARGQGGRVFAATSAYHLPRCLVLLRLAGLPARPVPPPPVAASRRFLKRWRWRLREVPALPWDVLLLLLRRLAGRL